MKLIIYFFFLLPTFLIAQNNLFFNQAKFVSLSTNTPVVVPDGKVWNLKGVSSASVNRSNFVLVDNVQMFVNGQNSVTTLQSIWFSAGNEIKRGGSTSCCDSPEVINVLEYDVVPVSTNTGTSESTGFSSSGLEFNKVINYTLDFGTGLTSGNVNDGHGVVANIIIPTGKAWKVQSVRVNGRDPFRNNAVTESINCSLTMGRTFLDTDPNSEPIWFGEGSYEIYGFNCGSNAALTINVLEFNIIN